MTGLHQGTGRRSWTATAWLLFAMLVVGLPTASGIIDPKFTPAVLVEQSDTIVICKVAESRPADEWQLTDVTSVKGRKIAAEAAMAMSLVDCPVNEAQTIRKLLQDAGGQQAVLFGAADEKGSKGYMHVGGVWLEVKSFPAVPGQWRVQQISRKMSATFAGGTEMLARLARQLVADPSEGVPVSVGVSWMNAVAKVGKVAGAIAGMEAVRCENEQQTLLFVASTQGDRIYRAKRNDETFEDVTAAMKLDTRSMRFAWADLDGDGRDELVTWDGSCIGARTLTADCTFKLSGDGFVFNGQCLAIAPCRPLGAESPAVLISTADSPMLLSRDRRGKWQQSALPGGDALAKAGVATMACVVADLDNDGYFDVLQPRANAGVLWMGTPRGFADPIPSKVCGGDGGKATSALGDFTQDGLLDIFISGAKANELWENDGKGNFRPILTSAGSLGYKSTPAASCCRATDLNHDGRTDLCLLYRSGEMAYHFNRGFGCFGEEGELRLAIGDEVDPTSAGQSACAVADFNGDGSLDLAVAFADGRIRCFYNEAYDRPMARIALAKGQPGPVTVSLWRDGASSLCVGVANIFGSRPNVLPLAGTCNVTLKWTLPNKPAQARRLGTPATCPAEGFTVLLP